MLKRPEERPINMRHTRKLMRLIGASCIAKSEAAIPASPSGINPLSILSPEIFPASMLPITIPTAMRALEAAIPVSPMSSPFSISQCP